MSKSILDSSAVLALLHQEPGGDRIWPLISEALMSAVNAAEVQGKLVRLGLKPSAAWQAVLGSVHEIVAFDSRQAELAGNWLPVTSSLGLSLGDRACLALGAVLQLPVYTADQAWKELQLGFEIHVIR